MKKIIILLITSVLLVSFTSLHDFFTSMTKVEYNPSTKILKFATKIDVEQTEGALGKKLGSPDFESSLKSYLQKNIEISVDGQSVRYDYTGKQDSGEIVWVYYEVSNVNSVNTIEVKNTLFFDKSPNQQNYISFNINGKKGSFVCTKGKELGKQQF